MSQEAGTASARRRRRLSNEHWAAIAVALLAILVFAPSVATGFVFDDTSLITENEYVHAWRWLPRAFTTHLWDVSRRVDESEIRRYYRPLVTVSYLVTWMMAGARPWAFHLGNVLLHGAAAGLAARAAYRWTASAFWAFALGLLFALHPSRTENVTWISGRTDVLMMLFVLAALEAFAAFERHRTSAPARAWTMFGVGLAAVFAGLLSKEPAAMLPLVMAAEAAAPVRSRRSRLPLWATSVVCGGYLLARALFFPAETNVARELTPAHCLVTIGAYLLRTVVPWPPTMYYHALAYDASGPVYPTGLMLLGAATALLWIAALVFAWRRARTAFWLLLASIGFMGPLLNVYFTGLNVSAQDRFLYAPLLFGAAGLVTLARALVHPLARRRRVARIVVGAMGLGWATLIQIRTPDYRDDRTFWESERRYNPKHPFVLDCLARNAAARGDLETAYDYFRRSALPESQRYRLVADPNSHFQQAVILAALLPDGRVEELRLLLDELWRTVEPDKRRAARGKVLDYEVGAPLRGIRSTTIHWDIVLLATRLGDFERAERALRLIPDRTLLASGSPLNDALALARLGRMSDAWAVHRKIRERPQELGELVPRRDLEHFAARLQRAEQLAAERDQTPAGPMRSALEAMRLAELGAFFAALRALEAGEALDVPELAPLLIQLLVACRLEGAALARATETMGPDRASAILDEVRGSLPPRLRQMQPAPGGLWDVLAQARHEK